MAWEERNGRRYYYRKKRIGYRVISVYIGTGDLAELLTEVDSTGRRKRLNQQLTFEAVKAEAKQQESAVNQISDLIQSMLHAALLATGHHTHKGQWRRFRDGQNRI